MRKTHVLDIRQTQIIETDLPEAWLRKLVVFPPETKIDSQSDRVASSNNRPSTIGAKR